MRVAKSAKVVFPKYENKTFMKQCGNKDWASFIKAMSYHC